MLTAIGHIGMLKAAQDSTDLVSLQLVVCSSRSLELGSRLMVVPSFARQL